MTEEERSVLLQAISMKLCWIETNTPILRTIDLIEQGKPVRALDPGQKKLIAVLEGLWTRVSKFKGTL